MRCKQVHCCLPVPRTRSAGSFSSVTLALIAFVLPARAAEAPCGSWEQVRSANLDGATNIVQDVSALSRDVVWAVGHAGWPIQTLAMRWDGTTWSITPTPNPSSSLNILDGVVALASDDAIAVGGYNSAGGSTEPLTLRWNGVEWRRSADLDFPNGAEFFAIDAAGPDEVWAVGARFEGAPGPSVVTLAARLGGDSWEVVPSLFVGDASNRFLDVGIVAPDDVWAVGFWNSYGSAVFHILIAHFDGEEWRVVEVQDPSVDAQLSGVAAIAPDDVWAVGDRNDIAGEGQEPLIMHWDGGAWSVSPLPLFSEGPATLEDIAAISPDDIWTVGTHTLSDGTPRPLLMHWDGTTWSVAPAGASGGAGEWFRGVDDVDECDVWAAGQFYDGTATATLTQRLTPGGSTTHVLGDELAKAERSVLSVAAWPNPMEQRTAILLQLPSGGAAAVHVFDPAGRQLRELASRMFAPGRVQLEWDGRDERGLMLPAGTYFVRLRAAEGVRKTQVIRLR